MRNVMRSGPIVKSFEFHLAGLESEVSLLEQPRLLPDHYATGFLASKDVSRFAIIADEQFNIGHAWFCTDHDDRIVRVSPEFGRGIEFVNSDFDSFLASLCAAADWSMRYDSSAIKNSPGCIDDLSASLSAIDPDAVRSSECHWSFLIQHLRTCATDADGEMELWFKIA